MVGDIIKALRDAITDQPGVLPAPVNPTVALSTAASSLPVGTYKGFITFRTPWGETLPNPAEFTVTTTSGSPSIQINAPALPPGAIIMRVYLTLAGGATGTEQQFIEGTVLPLVISSPGTMGLVPVRNTAYIMDADGDSFSCSTVYQWLNDGLKIASQICGGLIDYSGVGSVAGQPMYVVPGQWKRISDLWYDGYPLGMDQRGMFFRRNSITASVLASVATSLFTDRMMLEVWPQPSRTAAVTQLNTAMALTDTIANVVSAAGFLLAFGFAQIDSEIVAYSVKTGTTLPNLIRGLSGTAIAPHAAGATVQELNIFFGGWRMYAPNYQPGQAFSSIPVPVGWETMLPIYALARTKLAEQDIQGYSGLKKDFTDMMGQWYRTNHVTVGPRQVGESTSALEVLPSLGGGWVIP